MYDFLTTVTTYVDAICVDDMPYQAIYYAEVPYLRMNEFVNAIDGVINLHEINWCEVSFLKKHLLVDINLIVGIQNIKKYINPNTTVHEMLKCEEQSK